MSQRLSRILSCVGLRAYGPREDTGDSCGVLPRYRISLSGRLANAYDSPGKRWTGRAMDVREFEGLVDRLGEDFSRWPDAQRLAAIDLLATSATTQALLEEARALRSALAAPIVR